MDGLKKLFVGSEALVVVLELFDGWMLREGNVNSQEDKSNVMNMAC